MDAVLTAAGHDPDLVQIVPAFWFIIVSIMKSFEFI